MVSLHRSFGQTKSRAIPYTPSEHPSDSSSPPDGAFRHYRSLAYAVLVLSDPGTVATTELIWHFKNFVDRPNDRGGGIAEFFGREVDHDAYLSARALFTNSR
jgi:hypothetical protein